MNGRKKNQMTYRLKRESKKKIPSRDPPLRHPVRVSIPEVDDAVGGSFSVPVEESGAAASPAKAGRQWWTSDGWPKRGNLWINVRARWTVAEAAEAKDDGCVASSLEETLRWVTHSPSVRPVTPCPSPF